ncbi:outer membrane transport energization protein ExbD [Chromohalobacter marismortui]|uniref:Outer membrane transport energization protein ExbD n=1 Tax=Chromohalobacter marismortui TaxID=42055 RepID=A0A4R7NVM2_9GAMM|nr:MULTISPECIES: biopolymer transporter ExbD [Chromohalobacter]MCI0510356.1 biopolymer transporter ExbD [Chromohalobacter sp.]MCI0594759.1 biopolymer transporter ExbD [Chromohalobacter sp.]TDU25068.1 outer membrane transport energization protein ExbD [Chromohalobacter marismortui]
MRRRRLQDVNDDAQEINLTPMLDVVFIMLIFFIVTTSFIKESGVEIERPESSSATARPDAQVMVAITAENAVWVDGQPVDAHRVGNEVASLVSDEGGVVIQADRQSTTGLLIKVMDAIRDAGVDNVAVAANRGTDG